MKLFHGAGAIFFHAMPHGTVTISFKMIIKIFVNYAFIVFGFIIAYINLRNKLRDLWVFLNFNPAV